MKAKIMIKNDENDKMIKKIWKTMDWNQRFNYFNNKKFRWLWWKIYENQI